MSDPTRDEDAREAGPDEDADELTQADAGLTGGTGAVEGEATADPTGSRADQDGEED